jgi:GNAT superfamily N-acetyltransferase
MSNEQPRMSEAEPVELLEWDSAWWGHRTARVSTDTLTDATARSVDSWCRAAAIELLYLRCPAQDFSTVRVATAHGYRYVGIRLTMTRSLVSFEPSRPRPAYVRSSDLGDLSRLRSIAASSHTNTRFWADGNLPSERCGALYERWVEQDAMGEAQLTLVADLDGSVAGYVTVGLDAGVGTIRLIGVAGARRGTGVATALLDAALLWMAQHQATLAKVVTQGESVIAQRLYNRQGFSADLVELWFHKWFALR